MTAYIIPTVTLRPGQRLHCRANCWRCGAGWRNIRVDPPVGGFGTGYVICGLCAAVQAWIVVHDALHPLTDLTPRRRGRPPKHVPTLCPECRVAATASVSDRLCGSCRYRRQRDRAERRSAGATS